ncbi:MAG: Crp/Fnr family transcriptional regulator [Maribacter sp.]
MEADKNLLSFLKPQLRQSILENSTLQTFSKGTEILKQEQYVHILPIVLEGLVKVHSRFNEKELLLYYIEPAQSCVMTFYAALQHTPSQVYATVEETARILLLPVEHLHHWIKDYPDFNTLFYQQYNLRYLELLHTIGYLLNDKMDKRLYDYLNKKAQLMGNSPIKMSHNLLADELGTAREVITRVLKKLENNKKIKQQPDGIVIIDAW